MVVLGLGNPGPLYEHTRHNAGFDVVDKVAAFFQVKLRKRLFCKYRYFKVPGAVIAEPLTYMNRSGLVLRSLGKHIEDPSKLCVICDNMDLAVGGIRIRQGGGASGQKGLNSITEALGSPDFVRIYIGIGRPDEGVKVVDHVLQVESDPVKRQAYEKALEDAAKAVIRFTEGASIAELQSTFNRKGLL